MSARTDAAISVLVTHFRRDDQSCACGWGEHATQLGRSHAAHVADLALAAADAAGPASVGQEQLPAPYEAVREESGRLLIGYGAEECWASLTDNPTWHRYHAANALALAAELERRAAGQPPSTTDAPRPLWRVGRSQPHNVYLDDVHRLVALGEPVAAASLAAGVARALNIQAATS